MHCVDWNLIHGQQTEHERQASAHNAYKFDYHLIELLQHTVSLSLDPVSSTDLINDLPGLLEISDLFAVYNLFPYP